jgi:hypothetical protein
VALDQTFVDFWSETALMIAVATGLEIDLMRFGSGLDGEDLWPSSSSDRARFVEVAGRWATSCCLVPAFFAQLGQCCIVFDSNYR